jgi:hypothetical protein
MLGLNPTSHPFIRSFLSFYNISNLKTNLSKELNIEKLLINLKNKNFSDNDTKIYLNKVNIISINLEKQIKQNFPTYNYKRAKNLNFNNLMDLTLNKKNSIKFRSLFKLSAFITDYQNFLNDPLNYIFQSHIN